MNAGSRTTNTMRFSKVIRIVNRIKFQKAMDDYNR